MDNTKRTIVRYGECDSTDEIQKWIQKLVDRDTLLEQRIADIEAKLAPKAKTAKKGAAK